MASPAPIGHNQFSFETKDDIPRDVPKLYFFKAGIRDFLDDMRRMPSNERGVYATAIFCMYEMMEGLPADDKLASMTLGIDIREWRHIKPKLIARGLLYEKPSGRISNRRFEAEIIDYVTAFKKRQEAAAEREKKKREEGKIGTRSTTDRHEIGTRSTRNLAGLGAKPTTSVVSTEGDFSEKHSNFNGGDTTTKAESDHKSDLRARDLESELELELEKKKKGEEGADASPPPEEVGTQGGDLLKPPPNPEDRLTVDALKAFGMYNDLAMRVGLPMARTLTPQRRKNLVARLREHGGMSAWEIALRNVEASAFLRGRNGRGWVADFDFLVTASRFAKVVDGVYGNGAHAPDQPRETLEEEAMRLAAELEGRR